MLDIVVLHIVLVMLTALLQVPVVLLQITFFFALVVPSILLMIAI